ncbi:MAG: MFS transporter [Desulfomicrobium escambiense]|nr:MFS transporter [Desulfomicrobium escambiense]
MKRYGLLGLFPPDFLSLPGGFFSAYCCISVFFLFPLVLSLKGYEPMAVGAAWIIFEFVLLGTRGWVNRFLSVRGTRFGMISGAFMLAAGVSFLFGDLPYWTILLGRSLMGAGWGLFTSPTPCTRARVLPAALLGRGFGIAGLAPLLPQLGLIPLRGMACPEQPPRFYLRRVAPRVPRVDRFCLEAFRWEPRVMLAPLSLRECLKDCWKVPHLKAILLSGSVFAFGAAGIMPYVANAASEWGIAGSSFLWSEALAALATRLFWGGWVDRFGKKLLFPSFACISFGAMFSMALATTPAFLLGGVLYGFGMGLAYPLLYALLAKAAGEESKTALFTLFGTFIDLLWAIAPLVAAAGAQLLGFGRVLRGMALLLVVSVLFMRVWVWPWLGRTDLGRSLILR